MSGEHIGEIGETSSLNDLGLITVHRNLMNLDTKDLAHLKLAVKEYQNKYNMDGEQGARVEKILRAINKLKEI
jgi:hypothetical protein